MTTLGPIRDELDWRENQQHIQPHARRFDARPRRDAGGGTEVVRPDGSGERIAWFSNPEVAYDYALELNIGRTKNRWDVLEDALTGGRGTRDALERKFET